MNTDLLTERLEKVGWQLSANQLEGILEDASKNNVAYSDFLNSILMTEIEHRESTELSKRIKRARLPYFKTLEDFDFAFQPSINEKRVREVMTCRFIDNGFNVLLLGPPGVGKTHLAISIAAEAVTKGYRTSFITANDFVEECQKAEKSGLLPRIIKRYCRSELLILDEIGYFPFDPISANALFQIISKRYERGSIILTSNKSYIEWGKIFGDEVLATAILDRLLHHATTFNIRGDSYRMREKKRAGIQPTRVDSFQE
ncbi:MULTISPECIES: IS21-like element helper ATPase IstB [Exiguobacterium]|jgi:DNA replication protein DnaC|uniref:IS21-like element helper ATPase IstB n=4 Tax=Exiguobacterium TaxID=33986 RepID=A0ABY5FT15_9BACL|nr:MULTISPECIES: IS21-like element helper ATPase IstB [Exiguobacterium]MEB1809676.1 IS21-like element helper ATPase IstB [Bacillaceae bacterium]RHB45757.1 AAA family ATPase [Exiguobacterium sp. AM39-5BH]TCI23976.1 AAA family ATPase [Exiguobacterium sp. SH5S4]TCI49422.1 AAA family ATPase [Exiguobacterium sp. SH5S13]TCI61739.1 AAA family ATPase [Exiguobacterium sp. SH3S1]